MVTRTLTSIKLCLALCLFTIGSSYLSCAGSQAKFKIDTASPNGRYRLKLEGRTDPPNPLPQEFYSQSVTLEATKDSQILAVDDKFFREDAYDGLFLQRYPVHEWVSDSVLRLGDLSSKDSFRDDLIVKNSVKEQLSLVILQYGKYEVFFIYDLPPGKQVELKASPQLYTNVPATMVFYRAYAKDLSLSGNVGALSARNESPRPIKLVVEIVD